MMPKWWLSAAHDSRNSCILQFDRAAGASNTRTMPASKYQNHSVCIPGSSKATEMIKARNTVYYRHT